MDLCLPLLRGGLVVGLWCDFVGGVVVVVCLLVGCFM